MAEIIKILAPIKINLYLHVLNERDDGYHDLDSLVCFVNYGDQIKIEKSKSFSIYIEGSCAQELFNDKNNILVKAVERLCNYTGNKPKLKITLSKNIPIGAGLGGGSSDAAAIIRALSEFWAYKITDSGIESIAADLGSDVPVCLHSQPCHICLLYTSPSPRD